MFYISLCDASNKNYIDETIFKLRFIYYYLKSDENGVYQTINSTDYGLHTCTEDDVSFNPSIFVNMGLNNSIMLNYSSKYIEILIIFYMTKYNF